MASFVKYEAGIENMLKGTIIAFGTTDTFKVALTNSAPNVSTHAGLADITEISAGNGYSAGGTDSQNNGTRSGGTVTVVGVDIVFTASGGNIGPFRYAVLYDDTSSGDKLIGYWDYGSSVTLTTGQTFTVDFGASLFTVA